MRAAAAGIAMVEMSKAFLIAALLCSWSAAGIACAQNPVKYPYAIYHPATGEVTLNNITTLRYMGFADLGGLGLNPSNAVVFEQSFVDTTIPGEINWLLFTPQTGSGISLGAIAAPGLSGGLENYFLGIDYGVDLTFPLPVPIYSPSGAYLPLENPYSGDGKTHALSHVRYNPASGNVRIDEKDQQIIGMTIRGPGVDTTPPPNPLGGVVDVSVPNEISWSFPAVTSAVFDLGNVLPAGLLLSQLEEEYAVGLLIARSSGSTQPPYMFSLPFVGGRLVPEPCGLALASAGLLFAARCFRQQTRPPARRTP
jgi:hypothetical protein